MNSISLCMIVKNEEKYLSRCLNSIKDAVDEIIIVDTGSTDSTKTIAKQFTNNVYDFEWCDDFSKARNYAFSLAKSDYIMWLDADDIVPAETRKTILDLKSKLTADVYMLKYDIAFVDGNPTYSYYRERIVKNCKLAFWQGAVHECIAPFGKVEKLNISIHHKKEEYTHNDRNLKIYENLLTQRKLSPREQYYYGRELYDHKNYVGCINTLEDFVGRGLGWSENVIDALFIISICYKKLNNESKTLDSLFKTFLYDCPRANICCHIGDCFLERKQLDQAIFWYQLALNCEDTTPKGGFVENKYYNYYPYLQLCCAYFYLGNIDKAVHYNEKAGEFNHSEVVKKNREFFNRQKQ